MTRRTHYTPPPARWKLFGVGLTPRVVGVALAQGFGLAVVGFALYLVLVLGMALEK